MKCVAGEEKTKDLAKQIEKSIKNYVGVPC